MENDMSISVKLNGITLTVEKGVLLSDVAMGEKPCGGHGRCGKCKVIATGELSPLTDSEKKHLSADEIARGVRLACLTTALGDCEIRTLKDDESSQILTHGAASSVELSPAFSKYGVAIDIGTTTLAARLYDTKGSVIADTARLNPQIEWGADVISRIEASLAGKTDELAAAIRKAIDEMIAELASAANINALLIDAVAITGNTVMLYLLTEESVEPLSHAPFDAKRLFGESLCASELALESLKPETKIYLPNCISAFVGADTSCAIISTGLCEGKRVSMLADIGTNGEMAIWNGNVLTVCSTAAGPAFEGVGISMGMRGADGAIDRVSIVNGELCAHVIGGTAAKGICGSGLIDAVACMLDMESIDETGFLDDDEITVLAPVTLTQNDIRMVQLAKSAICAGILTLLDAESLSVPDVESVYVAGGFGNYLNMKNAEKIGLLPPDVHSKVTVVGNAALDGASMLLLNKKLRENCKMISKSAITLNLSANKVFSDHYIMGMMFGEME